MLRLQTMMRNGCLTLCQFSIPTDVVCIHIFWSSFFYDWPCDNSQLYFSFQLFEYERLVKILLHGVSDSEQEGFVQRIAIYLLNSLACLVDGRQKLFLGDLGAIGVSLPLWFNTKCPFTHVPLKFPDDVNIDSWSLDAWSIRRCHGSGLVNDVECHRRDSHQLWTIFGRPWNGILSRMFECMIPAHRDKIWNNIFGFIFSVSMIAKSCCETWWA